MIEEKGPWAAAFCEAKAFIESGDFTHDVSLYIIGDFENAEQKAEYAEEIARRLNTFAIRDAEVAELKRDIEACPKGWHHSEVVALEKERDQLREQVAMLRAWIKQQGEITDTCTFNILREVCENCACHRNKALAATEPKE